MTRRRNVSQLKNKIAQLIKIMSQQDHVSIGDAFNTSTSNFYSKAISHV